MTTPAHRLINDQNQNFLYNGTTPGGKADVAKAEKKGGLRGRKALNDISNSRKPTANVISIEKDPSGLKATGKGKAGGRKALSDVTNSVKLPTKHTGRKLNAVTEEKVPSCITEENFQHNHQKCIEAQTKDMDLGYFLETIGLSNDPSARAALPFSSKEVKRTKHLEMEEIPEYLSENDYPGYRSPASPSPTKSLEAPPYLSMSSWGDDLLFDLRVMESPKKA